MSKKRQERRRAIREELHPERKPKVMEPEEIISPEEKAKRAKKAKEALAMLVGISGMIHNFYD